MSKEDMEKHDMFEIDERIKEAEFRMATAEDNLSALGFSAEYWSLIREYITAALIRTLWIQTKESGQKTS